MPKKLIEEGYALVLRDPESGRLVVDTDTLEGVPEDNEIEGDEDEFGRRSRRERRRDRYDRKLDNAERRHDRRSDREDRRYDRRVDHLDRKYGDSQEAEKAGAQGVNMGSGPLVKTVLAGSQTNATANAIPLSIEIRPQHSFTAEDFSVIAPAGTMITGVRFGDKLAFDSPSGVDAAFFAPTSFTRGILNGQALQAGLSIIITGILPPGGTAGVSIPGLKPLSGC